MTVTKKYNPLIILFIITNGITFGINTYIDSMGSGGYISSLIWILISIVIYSFLFNKKAVVVFYRDKSVFKKLIMVLTLIVALFNLTALSAYFTEYFSDTFYTSSPGWYILSLLIIPSAIGCGFGIKTISRYAIPAVAVIILLTASIIVMSSSGYNYNNLYPLSGGGTEGVLTSIKGAACFGGVAYYYVLLCTDKTLAKAKSQKPLLIIALSGIFIFAVCLSCNLLLPYKAASLADKPLYTIASSVSANYLIERSEVLVLIIWLLSAFVCIAGIGTVALHISSVEFNLGHASPLTACIYATAFSIAILFIKYNITESMYRYSIYATSIMSVLLPSTVNLKYYLSR